MVLLGVAIWDQSCPCHFEFSLRVNRVDNRVEFKLCCIVITHSWLLSLTSDYHIGRSMMSEENSCQTSTDMHMMQMQSSQNQYGSFWWTIGGWNCIIKLFRSLWCKWKCIMWLRKLANLHFNDQWTEICISDVLDGLVEYTYLS